MFDNIVIFRNSQNGGPLIDTGMLAEALLFYGNVHLLLNRGTLHGKRWEQMQRIGYSIDRKFEFPT
jgi:hypothetical protein